MRENNNSSSKSEVRVKTVTIRNLLGGLLGGVAGIFLAWYMSPAFLPAGVLVGVVLGWWNESIVHLALESHRKARGSTSGAVARMVSFTGEALEGLVRLCGLSGNVAQVVRRTVTQAAISLVGVVAALPAMLWRAQSRFYRWNKAHQMNQAHVIDSVVSLLFVVGLPACAFFIESHVGITDANKGLLTFAVIIAAWGGFGVYRMQHEAAKNTRLSEICQYYREWEIISHRGWVGYLIYSIRQHIQYTIGTSVFVVVAVPWFVCMAAVGFLSTYPLAVLFIFARGLYLIAKMSGHRLCFGTTLMVTGISWLTYNQNFADPRILWSVALGTGIVSGGLTEVIRRILIPSVDNTRAGKVLCTAELCDLMGSYLETMAFKFGGMWFGQNRLARMFRFACFGFPVVVRHA